MRFRQVLRNLYRYGRRPSEIKKAFRAFCSYRCVASSSYFDKDWVIRQIPGFDNTNNPIFAVLAGGCNPSPDFVCSEYKLLHGLKEGDIHPLVHFERYGKKMGLALSFREAEINGRKRGVYKHLSFDSQQWLSEMEHIQSRLRLKVLSGARIRVCFLVYNAAIFPGRPVFERMLKDDLFRPVVLVIPSYLWPDRVADSMKVCYDEMCALYGSDCVVLAKKDDDGLWYDYLSEMDMVCFSSPYDISDPHYNPHWVVHREILSFYFNYSYIVANFSLEVFKSPNFSYFWRVFFESESIFKEFSKYSVSHGVNGAVVGYVKMDDSKFDRTICRGGRKTILIALHHTVSIQSSSSLLPIATFLLYSELFLELPTMFPQLDFIFRPHPLLIPALAQKNIWGSEKTEHFFSKLGSLPNVRICTSGSYLDLFAESDGLIEDCGSFLAEYFYTDKPHCYMIKSREIMHQVYTKFGISCLDHCYKAFSREDIIRFIQGVILEGEDQMRESRRNFQRVVMVNYPHASNSVIATIKQMLA